MPRFFTSVTSLSSLEGIEPIAEALIKTLAGKARTGVSGGVEALKDGGARLSETINNKGAPRAPL
jgi:hypothetical protein